MPMRTCTGRPTFTPPANESLARNARGSACEEKFGPSAQEPCHERAVPLGPGEQELPREIVRLDATGGRRGIVHPVHVERADARLLLPAMQFIEAGNVFSEVRVEV